jgi:cell division protein FtsL
VGLPALRHEASPSATRRSHLRVVHPRNDARSRQSHAHSHAAVFQSFTFFAVAVVLVSGLGVGRVWLSAQATQASLDSAKLTRDIKLEQYQGDVLEVQQSALSAPSRIQAIAAGTLGMAAARSVSYLDLGVRASGHAGPAATAAAGRRESGAITTVLQAAASEARVLLVGDVGLSSSK